MQKLLGVGIKLDVIVRVSQSHWDRPLMLFGNLLVLVSTHPNDG